MPAKLLHPLKQRDPNEHGRVATTLELLLDLASVIAIASAAAGLHHAISENHVTDGLLSFAMAFFGIWWAWMNYTWFASAYDDGSRNFRLSTFTFIAGALIMAAGITQFFKNHDLSLIVAGYVVMRVVMIWLWLCAAKADSAHRQTALRYATGIAITQAYWCALLLIDPQSSAFLVMFLVGVIGELAVPFVAERSGMTPWHRHHVIERYGLLNIIVLGELMLAAAGSLREMAEQPVFDVRLMHVFLCAALITFSFWSLYFTDDEHLENREHARAFSWGYGHIFLFAAGAATGAGFGVLVDILTHHSEASLQVGDAAVAIPVAIYLAGLWLVRDRFICKGWRFWLLPVAALFAVATPFLPAALELCTATAVAAAVVRGRAAQG